MKNYSRRKPGGVTRYRSPSGFIARGAMQQQKRRAQGEFGQPTAKGSRPRRFGTGETAR